MKIVIVYSVFIISSLAFTAENKEVNCIVNESDTKVKNSNTVVSHGDRRQKEIKLEASDQTINDCSLAVLINFNAEDSAKYKNGHIEVSKLKYMVKKDSKFPCVYNREPTFHGYSTIYEGDTQVSIRKKTSYDLYCQKITREQDANEQDDN